MQKVYVCVEEKERIMERLSRDIDVRKPKEQTRSSSVPFTRAPSDLRSAVPGADADHGLQPAAGDPRCGEG